ncbi:DUF2807 domain-containing protein [Marinilabiliaceae bacterium JC017]|nr:DUF2807 domain-containing protein [Marinilabiliaceae bacterium JC017]
MKHIHTLLILLFIAGLATAQEQETHAKEKQVRKVGSFDKVKATKGINITLIEGDKEQAEVHINNGSTSDVITELKNKTLTLKMRTRIYKGVAVQVYVTYVRLREIDAGTGASIDAENTIVADKLSLRAGTESSIELDVDVNALSANVSAGRMEIEGKAGFQEVKASAGGKYLAYDLECDETYAKSSTGARIEVTANKKLNATASAGGTVNYKGNPAKIQQKVSMGGKVNDDN